MGNAIMITYSPKEICTDIGGFDGLSMMAYQTPCKWLLCRPPSWNLPVYRGVVETTSKEQSSFCQLGFPQSAGPQKVFLPQRALSWQNHRCPPVPSVVWMVSAQVADASAAVWQKDARIFWQNIKIHTKCWAFRWLCFSRRSPGPLSEWFCWPRHRPNVQSDSGCYYYRGTHNGPGTVTVASHHIGLGLTAVSKSDRDDLLGVPVSVQGLFGSISLVVQHLKKLEESCCSAAICRSLTRWRRRTDGNGTWQQLEKESCRVWGCRDKAPF